MHSAGKDELRVILEPDERVLSDLRLLIKTDKYTKRKQTTSLSAIEEQILRSKAALNRQREKDLVQRIQSSVGKAALVINAADVTASSQDALGRVTEGFQELISRTYIQLKLLGAVTYSEQQVAGAANPESGLFDANALLEIDPPAEEVMSFIVRRENLGEQVTMKTIVDAFQAKPYGWDLAAIEVIVASLIGVSKITLTMDGNVLKRGEVAAALRNTQKHSHEIVASQKTFDEQKVSNFRKFCTDFFDENSAPRDPLELAQHCADKLKGRLDELRATVSGSKYPFVGQLSSAIGLLEQAVGKSDDWYLNDFNFGEELLEAKENLIDPIQSFLNGAQRSIYDQASTLLITHSSNLSYLPSGGDETIKSALLDPNAFRGNKMAQLKQAVDDLRSQIDNVVARNRSLVSTTIEGRRAELLGGDFFAKATPEARQSVTKRVDQILARVVSESQVALILQIGATFESTDFPALLDTLAASQEGGDSSKQTVSVKTISVIGVSGVLETEEDVEEYLAALRGALIQTLNNGKRVSL